jgi:hypothetical protein
LVEEEEQRVVVSSTKVCRQQLPLPPGVSVIQFVPAAGHLSSSRNVANSWLQILLMMNFKMPELVMSLSTNVFSRSKAFPAFVPKNIEYFRF